MANLAFGRSGRWAGISVSPIRTRIPATFLLALDAEVESRRGGEPARRTPISEFVVGPYQTSLGAGEVLTSVRIPELPRGAAVAHAKFAFHERPTATVACLARVVEGEVAEARVAVDRSAPARCVLRRRKRCSPELPWTRSAGLLAEAGERAAEAAAPVDDATGSAEYKAQLVRVLVERTFREAVA